MRNILINYFGSIEQRSDKGLILENFCFRVLTENYEQDQIKYWRTADGNEIDFIVETQFMKGFAVEVKFSEQQAKPSKYKKFVENYPEFPLEFWWWKNLKFFTA